MKIVTIIVRILLGLMFFAGGLAFFFMKMPEQHLEGNAEAFTRVMMTSHYMQVVKCFEITGGFFLLLGRYVPLGLTLLGPVIVNILLCGILINSAGLIPGIVVSVLGLFLLWRYRSAFAGLVKP